MSTDQIKNLAREMVEKVLNGGNMGLIDELLSPEFVEHEELPPGMPRNREGVRQLTGMLRSAFPDFKATIEDLVAEGDKVTIRQTWTGTHKGEFMGIPATGRKVSFGVIDIMRFAGGKCTDHWGLMDSLLMMQQLGVMPGPEDAKG